MRSLFNTFFFLLSLAGISCQQRPVPEALLTPYAPLNKKLASTVSADEYVLSPQQAEALDNPIYLDARELAEYQVSHLPNALMIGYDKPDFSILDSLDRQRPVVVYCTIGYRSERIAKKLRDRGFPSAYNLYGSIYAWTLAGLPLENAEGKTTRKVHTYNKKWGTYFPGTEKVY